ncbi:MAG: DUF6690 family protein, partial [Planctomycetota bacterium]
GGVLQRIRLDGRTADTSRIVALAAQRFGMTMQPAASPGDQLLQAREGGRVRAELRTRPEPVLWATSPHTSFRVRMELNRPGGPRWVEPTRLQLDLPPPTGAGAATPAIAARPENRPILPPRSVIPDDDAAPVADAGQPSSAPQPATGQAATSPASSGVSAPAEPKPPIVGKPTEAPRPQTAPLDGYRDRFRWPG